MLIKNLTSLFFGNLKPSFKLRKQGKLKLLLNILLQVQSIPYLLIFVFVELTNGVSFPQKKIFFSHERSLLKASCMHGV